MRAQTIKDFRRAVGDRVAHVTAAGNLSFILAHGLVSAHELAESMFVSPGTLPLRNQRLQIEGAGRRAILNHQLPILHGLNAANAMVEGHTAQTWAAALDQRVYLWPKTKGAEFARSVSRDLPIEVIWLDTEGLAEVAYDVIDLAPINTGNFTQGGAHARRGDWIYVPLSRGLEAFRENRRQRGLATTRDTVKEISLRRGIQADVLQTLRVSVT